MLPIVPSMIESGWKGDSWIQFQLWKWQIMLPEESKEMNREGQMVKKDDSGASSGSTIPLILMQILMQFAHAVMNWHM